MKYRVEGEATVTVVTLVRANSEEEAIKIAQERDVDICIHGSELALHGPDETQFVLEDGSADTPSNLQAAPYE